MFFYKLEKNFEYVSIKALQVHSLISQYIQVKKCRLKLDKYYRYSNYKGHSIKNYTPSGELTLTELNSPSATCPPHLLHQDQEKNWKKRKDLGWDKNQGDCLMITVVVKQIWLQEN